MFLDKYDRIIFEEVTRFPLVSVNVILLASRRDLHRYLYFIVTQESHLKFSISTKMVCYAWSKFWTWEAVKEDERLSVLYQEYEKWMKGTSSEGVMQRMVRDLRWSDKITEEEEDSLLCNISRTSRRIQFGESTNPLRKISAAAFSDNQLTATQIQQIASGSRSRILNEAARLFGVRQVRPIDPGQPSQNLSVFLPGFEGLLRANLNEEIVNLVELRSIANEVRQRTGSIPLQELRQFTEQLRNEVNTRGIVDGLTNVKSNFPSRDNDPIEVLVDWILVELRKRFAQQIVDILRPVNNCVTEIDGPLVQVDDIITKLDGVTLKELEIFTQQLQRDSTITGTTFTILNGQNRSNELDRFVDWIIENVLREFLLQRIFLAYIRLSIPIETNVRPRCPNSKQESDDNKKKLRQEMENLQDYDVRQVQELQRYSQHLQRTVDTIDPAIKIVKIFSWLPENTATDALNRANRVPWSTLESLYTQIPKNRIRERYEQVFADIKSRFTLSQPLRDFIDWLIPVLQQLG